MQAVHLPLSQQPSFNLQEALSSCSYAVPSPGAPYKIFGSREQTGN